MSSDSWQCQGRQYHGWFGDGTCPDAENDSKAPGVNCLNASTDRVIEASIPFLSAPVTAMYRQWLAQKQGRQILHQAVQKLSALAAVSKDQFKRLANWTHGEAQDMRSVVRNVVDSAKKPTQAAANKAGALIAKQLDEHGPTFLEALEKVAGVLAGGTAQAEQALKSGPAANPNKAPASTSSSSSSAKAEVTSARPKVDIDKVVSAIDASAQGVDAYRRLCAKYVHAALAEGGLGYDAQRPIFAGQNGPWLQSHGAVVVATNTSTSQPTGYVPQKGDIAVFPGSASHQYGHMQLYDGSRWVSDTFQTTFSPGKDWTGGVTVYRFSD